MIKTDWKKLILNVILGLFVTYVVCVTLATLFLYFIGPKDKDTDVQKVITMNTPVVTVTPISDKKIYLGNSKTSFESEYGTNYTTSGNLIFFQDTPMFITLTKNKVTSITLNYENNPFDITSKEALKDIKEFLPEDTKPVSMYGVTDDGKEVSVDTSYFYKSITYANGFNLEEDANIMVVLNFNSNGVYLASAMER